VVQTAGVTDLDATREQRDDDLGAGDLLIARGQGADHRLL
jgi:hypothetical protein